MTMDNLHVECSKFVILEHSVVDTGVVIRLKVLVKRSYSVFGKKQLYRRNLYFHSRNRRKLLVI